MKEYLIKLRDFLENSDYNLLYREMVGEFFVKSISTADYYKYELKKPFW